jgi:Zn-dependent M28 family amino/carboxypeptidase
MPLKRQKLSRSAIGLALGLVIAGPVIAQMPTPPILDPATIKRDVEILSGDAFFGRGPGEAGEAPTLDYLVGQFSAAGLSPGGENGTWFQDVALTRYQRDGATASLAVNGETLPVALATDISVTSMHIGRNAIAEVPLVFVGFGVDEPGLGYDQFGGVDLTGKVAVFLMNDPDYASDTGPFNARNRSPQGGIGAKKRAAFARGAVAVLQIHQFETASWPFQQISNSDPDPKFVRGPTPERGTDLTGTLRWEVATDLFQRAGLDLPALALAARTPAFRAVEVSGATMSADFIIAATPMITRNVIAMQPGTTRADETVIYGAHWDAYGIGPAYADGDTLRNGAVDNGIGTATLLEVARTYAAAPPPQRTVLFIGYTSEEDGLLCAYEYALRPLRPLETTAAVFNLDPHLALPLTRSLELIGAGRTELEADLARVADAQGLSIEAEHNPAAGWYGRSDHFTFAEQGVPTVYFRAGSDLVEGGIEAGMARIEAYNSRDYHQRSDEFDPSWDMVAAAQEGTVAYLLGREIADSGRWPAWNEGVPYKALRDVSASSRP